MKDLEKEKESITFVNINSSLCLFTMVNTEEFTKRLHKIMDFYELSAASFADKIDVGRSSISHLLSGRNKPSLDFVMKIINTFPEVELYWLLNGKGSFPKRSDSVSRPKISSSTPSEVIRQPDLFSEKKEVDSTKDSSERKTIKKVLVLYTDGSFDAFEN